MVHKRHGDKEPIAVTLPIVPFLDLAFQLLFYFIITFRSPQQERQLPMRLPGNDEPPSQSISPPKDDIPEEKAEEFKVVVTAGSSDKETQQIGSIRLSSESGNVVIDGEGMVSRLKGLRAALADVRTKAEQGKRKTPTITIQCQDDLTYANLIRVMDACRQEKFESVSVGPIEKSK
jgi:biopolymer transport protein ExbD